MSCWNDLQSYGCVPNFEACAGYYSNPDLDLSLRVTIGQELIFNSRVLSGDMTLRESDITRTISRPPDFPLWGDKVNAFNSDIIAALGSIQHVKQSRQYSSRGTEITDDDIWGILTSIPYQTYSRQMYYTTGEFFADTETGLTTRLAIGQRITKKDASSRKQSRPERRIIAQRQDVMTRVGHQALKSTTVFSINPRTGEIGAHIKTNNHLSSPLDTQPEDQISQIIDACTVLSRRIPKDNDPLAISRRPLHDERPQN